MASQNFFFNFFLIHFKIRIDSVKVKPITRLAAYTEVEKYSSSYIDYFQINKKTVTT